ncbi:hypothetical protein GCM10018966_079330 [Streptomyces yanii]
MAAGASRSGKPERLRLQLFSVADQIVTTGRRRILRLAACLPWTHLITDTLQRLEGLPHPG